MEGPAAGGLLEQVLGALVGEPASPGDRAEVLRGGSSGGCGPPVGEEERPGAAVADQPGQEAGGARERDDLGGHESAEIAEIGGGYWRGVGIDAEPGDEILVDQVAPHCRLGRHHAGE